MSILDEAKKHLITQCPKCKQPTKAKQITFNKVGSATITYYCKCRTWFIVTIPSESGVIVIGQ